MSYRRVIPRDLFNEANLLKCLGRLWICLDESHGHRAELIGPVGLQSFHVMQSDDDGSIYAENVQLLVAGYFAGRLYQPLNSREDWPLWLADPDDGDDVSVFDDQGNLSAEFWEVIKL